jgi:ABC-type antimicrobial peptide transport system permease subunit
LKNWLEDYDYRIGIKWQVFALAAAVALVITLITVSFQAIKAAITNPVKSLRTE